MPTIMPLSPSSGLSGRFSSYSAYSSYPSYSRSSSSSSSASSYPSRTDSTRSRSSTYTGSTLGSSYYPGSYYKSQSSALPPRPSYTSNSSDNYRLSRTSTRESPSKGTGSSYSSYRSTPDSKESSSASSRYPLKSSRDSSSSRDSRDSGYASSSYLSSRYASYDLPNGTSSRKRTDSTTSITNDTEDKKEDKVRVSDSVKSYSNDTTSSDDPFEARLNERRKRLGLSPVRVTKSPIPATSRYGSSSSPSISSRKNEDSSSYITGCSGGGTSTGTKYSWRSAFEPSELSTSSTLKEPTKERIRTDSSSSDTKESERDRKKLESPLVEKKSSRPTTPTKLRDTSPDADESKKPVERPSIRIEPEPVRAEPESIRSVPDYTSSNSLTSRTRRSDRIKDRIAARLASELDGVQPSSYSSSYSSSSSSGDGGSSDVYSDQNGLVGLRNIGNTCFLNSVTQCLSNTPPLMEYLVKEGVSSSDVNTTTSSQKGELIKAFGNLLNEMWRGNPNEVRSPINTSTFKTQIQRFAPQFIGYQQHDAQEFLRKLLEGLHEDVNRVQARSRVILDDIDDDLDDRQKATEAWKRYLRYDDSKIVDMFVGQLMSCLQCSSCGYRSLTFDPFWDLSLPIPPNSRHVKIQSCLELFTKEEVLDGDERPRCSKCKERRRMTKRFSIQRFPKVLVLHLKRFSQLERWRGKLTCNVDFPLDGIDLSSYASGVGCSGSGAYKLLGMANHSGTSHSGHYTAYCKHPFKGQWYEYNDSRVSNIASHRVCSPEAYLLFYELKY